MCGIAGFAGAGTVDDLQRMNAAQASRGPDAEGVYHDAGNAVFLGHQRLSILDIAGGAQPMWMPDGQIGITFNGEIYNHAELRSELRALGAVFATDHSDTEVLLHAYRHWGDGFVDRLNGMWAFVIYDRNRRRLFASRDRFGKKPFYYTSPAGFFAFASELTALAAHPLVSRTPSRIALKKYFAYGYIPAPHAYLEGVCKLPGGCNLEYDLQRRQLRTWRYWEFRLEPTTALPRDPECEWGEQLRELLAAAVRRRLIADVPIGTFLSGGIDSSAVSVLAAQAVGGDRLQTFSIGFEEASFDESAYARRVAGLIGSSHHHRVFSEAAARGALPALMARLDEPMADCSLLPTWFLCKHARERVTVALGGDGADELFAGYDPFRALRWAKLYEKYVPRPAHRAIALLASRLPVSHRNMSLDFRIKRTLRGLDYRPALWCPIWMAPLAPDQLAELFAEPIDPEEVYSDAIAAWDACQATDLPSRVLEFFTKFYLQDDILTKVDRASMAHSLEVRAPFLDIDLVDFVRRLPTDWKLRGGTTKALLKSSLAPLLPADIVHRPKKGFGAPIGSWFRSAALPLPTKLPDGLNIELLRRKGLAHRAGRTDEGSFLWSAYVLDHRLAVPIERCSEAPRLSILDASVCPQANSDNPRNDLEARDRLRADVTLAIPMHNSAPFLPRLFASINKLSLSPREILIHDDASADGSHELAREFALAYAPRGEVRLSRSNTNEGVACTYNRLISAASSTWIQILDADDAFENDFYSKLDLETAAGCVAIAASARCNQPVVDTVFRAFSLILRGFLPRWLPLLGLVTTRSALVYRAETVRQIPFLNPAFDGSDIVHFLLMHQAGKISFNRRPIIHYTIHRTSATTINGDSRRYRQEIKRLRPGFAYSVDLWLRKSVFSFLRRRVRDV